ncbi:MAG: hypothetical protein V1672_05710 [Candidatus Diapherotrites archaeon]
MSDTTKIFIKSAFFFSMGVILSTLFVWSLIEGVITHFHREMAVALLYYFAAWLSGIAAIGLYWQSRKDYRYAQLSE